MSIKQTVIKTCDLHPDREGAETIEFSLDGTGYEIDLSEEPARMLRDVLQPYIDAGRRKPTKLPTATDKPARGEVTATAKAKRDKLATIREWARSRPEFANLVTDRGRVRAEIVQAWEKDQQGHSEQPPATAAA
jgi:nucleoid-associated protein Lsr2